MRCIKCSIDLQTKYLGICEKCRTISWSPKYLNKNLKAVFVTNKKEFTGLEGLIKEPLLIKDAINKVVSGVSQDIGETFYINGEKFSAAYAIKLNKSWSRNNIAYEYYIGGTEKHPAWRFLEHLFLYKNRPLEISRAMKHVEEFIWKKRTNTNVKYKLEEALAKKYCKNGFLVYSDKHKNCKKCRPK